MAIEEHISWDLFEKETVQLAEILKDKGPWQGIVGIARGGLVATAIIANALDIRNVKSVAVTSYEGKNSSTAEMLNSVEQIFDGDGWLFIDDLVDSGQTAELLKRRYPKAKIGVVYSKPKGAQYADFAVRAVDQDCWIYFPWEVDAV